MTRYLRSLPVQLILSIVLAFILGGFLSRDVISIFYTISSCFIELLLFILPLMVFTFIFLSISKMKKQSLKLVLFCFLGVFLSNFIALSISYLLSRSVLPLVGIHHHSDVFTNLQSLITPLLQLQLPNILSADKAMILGIVLGFVSSFSKDSEIKSRALDFVAHLGRYITLFLHRIFIPLLPFYVFGFCLKLSYEKSLFYLFESYSKVFVISVCMCTFYILFLYILSSKGNIKLALTNIKKMIPAGLTGFSTMSSAATMPVTLQCTEQTTKDRDFTDLVIPMTSNIHMIGDDLTIVMTAMTLLTMFGFPFPELSTFVIFASAFCVAKLSCVGIPGASVLVILPVLQNFLNFSPEMITVLTTIYVLQDPFGTATNVMGNGAFALLLQRFFKPQPKPARSIQEV